MPQWEAGEEVRAGREGIKSRLYAITIADGKETRTLIRENLYPPKDAVFKKLPA